MDDRKRVAVDDPASTPPLKKQATKHVQSNGTSVHPDHDMPWKDDIERYQKDALLRQMREYKRERNTIQQQLDDLNNRSAYHDEHLRVIDSWFLQLIDELTLLTTSTNPTSLPPEESLAFSSSLLKSDNDQFESHLLERSSQIKSKVSQIFLHAPSGAPQVVELQQRISEILSTEKLHAIELQRLVQEKDATSERLENAVSRYMIAEKKLDRARSAQVAKLEAQATAASRPEPSSSTPAQGEAEATDGPVGVEVDRARKEAVALAEKRQQQLEILVKQNVRMENELAAMKAKFEALSDDDYAKSELFQTIKSQLDDTVKRVNDLEAQNIQLREEAKLLQSERTTYRDAADTEVREQTMDMQSQLAQGEQEVVRLRHARDEVKAELSTRLATMDQHTTSQAQLREMIEAKDLRIQTLESETERLRQASQANLTNGTETGEDALETQRRHAESERAALESEVRSMEAAYRKAQAIASRKVTEIVDWEDRLQRFSAEKAKADQKYFASMKNIEAKNAELRALKAQAARSTDMVSTLKEAESTSRLQVETLGKQVAEMKESMGTVTNQYRSVQHTITEQKALINRLEAHSNEFKKQVAAKVELVQAAEKAQRSAEGELEELKVRLGTTQKQVETLKKKGSGQQSEEFEMLRTIAQCNVCHSNWKNTVLKTCGHVCCEECVEKQIAVRSRKCPLCGKQFGKEDYMRITL